MAARGYIVGTPGGPYSITRRDFMRRASVLAASIPLASVLAACGIDDDESGEEGEGSTPSPRRGGTMQVEMQDFYTTDILDPLAALETFTLCTAGNIFEPLVTVDSSFNVRPVLAAEYSSNDDATVWTFRLRDGVEFHDGKTLTAADVVYSLQRHFEPESASVFGVIIFPYLDASGIRALDDQTVEFSLSRPTAYLPEFLATDSFAIVPEGQTDFEQPVGTGPFKFDTYVQGDYSEWIRNENYWESGIPYLDSVRIVRNADPNSKVQAVVSGDAHLIDGAEYSTLPTVDQAAGVKRLPLKNAVYLPLSLDQRQEPFTDVRVRQAFKMAVDRDLYVEQLYRGAGQASPDIPVPPDDPFFPASLEAFPYDVAGARALLRDAGYPNGFDLDIYTAPSGPGQLDATVVHAQFLDEIGVRTNIVQQTVDVWAAESYLQKPAVQSWISREHWAAITVLAYSEIATFSESYFQSEDFNRLLFEAIGTRDPDAAKEVLTQALDIMNQECGELIPAHGDRVYVAKENVHGLEFTHTQGYLIDFRHAYLA